MTRQNMQRQGEHTVRVTEIPEGYEGEYRLKADFSLEVYFDGEDYVAEARGLCLMQEGYGATEQAAVDEMTRVVFDTYHQLCEEKNKLEGLAQEAYERLGERIEKF